MHKHAPVAFGISIAVVGILFVGCDSPDNAAACQAYIDKVNTLDCFQTVKFTYDILHIVR